MRELVSTIMKLPQKIDISTFLTVFGRESAFFNWRVHLAGYRDFSFDSGMIEIASQKAGCSLYSPINRNKVLEIVETEEEYQAYDFDNDIVYQVNDFDFNACQLNEEKFIAWLQKILVPSNRQNFAKASKNTYKLWSDPISVYFIFPCSLSTLVSELNIIVQAGVSMVIVLDVQDLKSSLIKQVRISHPNIVINPLNDFIGLHDKGEHYQYIFPQRFEEYINGFAPAPPASFLPRPANVSWKHLVITIHTTDRDSTFFVEGDAISAEYVVGKINIEGGVSKVPLKSIVALGKSQKKRGRFVKMLFELARTNGMYYSEQEKHKTVSDLRKILCAMFGYNRNEDPIPNPTSNAEACECAFTIRFSDSQSDPINRTQFLRQIK